MRLFAGQLTPIAQEVVRALTAAGDIETEQPKEVSLDVEATLKQYLADEREVNDRARELLERTGRGSNEYNRVRLQIAEQKGIKVGDEMLDYLLDQVIEIFHHSANVEEIFAEDVEMRRKMAQIFKRHLSLDSDLDAEVRGQLRHMTEGSRTWDVEYARVMEQVKRKKGL